MTHDLVLTDVTHRYGDTTALDELTLTFEGGRIHGLLGRNGSGKTTLLSIAAAFRRASEGQALIGGEPVFENPDAMSQICLIRSAGDTIDSDWPGDRGVDAFRIAAAFRPYWDQDFADELADRFELDPKKRLGELSQGKRSVVGVILGLASRAPVTMLDETYLGMDAPSRYAFYDALLADVMEHPRTMIISTHLIEEVSSLFEHVTIIEAGRLILHEEAEQLRERGVSVTGPSEAVDRFVADQDVLSERQLGRTKSAAVFGELDHEQRSRAREAGLDLDPIALQDLFVHLTASTGERA